MTFCLVIVFQHAKKSPGCAFAVLSDHLKVYWILLKKCLSELISMIYDNIWSFCLSKDGLGPFMAKLFVITMSAKYGITFSGPSVSTPINFHCISLFKVMYIRSFFKKVLLNTIWWNAFHYLVNIKMLSQHTEEAKNSEWIYYNFSISYFSLSWQIGLQLDLSSANYRRHRVQKETLFG